MGDSDCVISLDDEKYKKIINEKTLDSISIEIPTKTVRVRVPAVHQTWLVSSLVLHEFEKRVVYSPSLSQLIKMVNVHHPERDGLISMFDEGLTETKRLMESLIGYPEHVIWSHLIYDKAWGELVKNILLYSRRPYDMMNDAIYEALSDANVECPLNDHEATEALFIFSRNNQLVFELVQLSLMILTRPRDRFQDPCTFEAYFKSLFLDLEGIFRSLCCFAFLDDLKPLVEALCSPILALWCPLVDSCLAQVTKDILSLSPRLASPHSDTKTFFKCLNQMIDHLAALLGLCHLVQGGKSEKLENIMECVLYEALNEFRQVSSSSPHPTTFNREHLHLPKEEDKDCQESMMGSLGMSLGVVLNELQEMYTECVSNDFVLKGLLVGRIKLRRMIVLSAFNLLTLPIGWERLKGKTKSFFRKGIYDWLMSLFLRCEAIGKEHILQNDFQLAQLTFLSVKLFEETNWCNDLEVCDIPLFTSRFLTRDAIPSNKTSNSCVQETAKQNISNEQAEALKNITAEECEAVEKIRVILEGDECPDDARILFVLRSSCMNIDRAVDQLLDEKQDQNSLQPNMESSCEKRENSTFAQSARNDKDDTLKDITINLVKQQYLKEVRSAMRQGLTIVTDAQFRNAIPETNQWLGENCDASMLTKGSQHGEYVSGENLDNAEDPDDPDEEFIELFSPLDFTHESQEIHEKSHMALKGEKKSTEESDDFYSFYSAHE